MGVEVSRAEGVRRLYELMRRVNSSFDPDQLLEEIARGVVEVLGFGVAAIARLEGDTFVMTTCVGPEHVREQIVGRRTPVSLILGEFSQADEWGILRYVPHDRLPTDTIEAAWIPDYEPSSDPDAWHPLDALYAPLYSATGDLLGNMSVDLPAGGRIPSQEDRELLEMFVVQAGLAMSNAQHRERLAEQVRLGEMLRQVSAAGRLVGLDRTLGEAARVVATGLGASQVWIRCFPDGERSRTSHGATYPASGQLHAELDAIKRELSRVAWNHGQPLVFLRDADPVEELSESRRLAEELMVRYAAAGLVAVPLAAGRELLGYLVVMSDAVRPSLSEAELGAVEEIGRELGRIVLNARLYETERRLVAELQELDRYKGELIATISHELKTPLTSIIGHVELLDDLDTGAGSVEAIARNAQRLNRLIENLLNYSRVQQNQEALRLPVDLRALCDNTLEMLSLQIANAGLTVSLDAPPRPVVVSGNPEELARVIDNIIGNAVKYTPSGGTVGVVVSTDGSTAQVSCTDTGLGISAVDQSHLFSAFHRSSNPDALSIPGTGLGLAISRRIVEVHGGEILVDSELGVGSTFRLRLPLRAPAALTPRQRTPA